MIDFFRNLFSSADFMPHGHCYFWRPEVVWLHVISDSLITLSYYSIPVMLWFFVRKRPDVPFHWLFFGFAIFIFGCGTTHLMEVWTVWEPVYRLAGVIKLLTAVVSVMTAVALVWILPQALMLKGPGELAKLNQQLEIKNAQLTAANEELESFSYTISHDLRAPLRHIDGFSKLLQEESASKLDEKGLHHLKTISKSAQEMSKLTEALLAFSHMGRSEFNVSKVDLESVVQEVIREHAHDIGQRRIEWKIGPLPTVRGDLIMLRLAFTNLISNAIKYTRPRDKAEIEIGSTTEDGGYVFHIRDNGVGFDMANIKRLFGVFQRLHHAEDFEGTGIGLANVQRIIGRHGGRIWAESVLDQGTTFYFTLPREYNPSAA